MAAQAFLKMFRWLLGLILLFCILLFILIGYTISSAPKGYQGEYEESRTGRIEAGQVRYVKNTLHYIPVEALGLPQSLSDGTHINLYFDKNGKVVASENADELNRLTQFGVILAVAAMGGMALALMVFAVAARKTFGKPWFIWLEPIKSG